MLGEAESNHDRMDLDNLQRGWPEGVPGDQTGGEEGGEGGGEEGWQHEVPLDTFGFRPKGAWKGKDPKGKGNGTYQTGCAAGFRKDADPPNRQ